MMESEAMNSRTHDRNWQKLQVMVDVMRAGAAGAIMVRVMIL